MEGRGFGIVQTGEAALNRRPSHIPLNLFIRREEVVGRRPLRAQTHHSFKFALFDCSAQEKDVDNARS
jgi:hypothetical protein